jgi:uncharacterized protein (DUF58 family)
MSHADRSVPLPCPRVAFETGFAARLERIAAEIHASRERREGLGSLAGALGGSEFVGYRAYTPGDDPRRIDWDAYARLDRALVRVTRREAGERWAIVVDASASMGVGPPGKLQVAAEVALGLTALALRHSARAFVAAMPRVEGRARSIEIDRRARLADLFAFLESLEARGRADRADLLALERDLRGAQRVFVVSDLLSFAPGDVTALASARCSVHAIRILAPRELGAARALAPAVDGPRGDDVRAIAAGSTRAQPGAVEWVDPESGERIALELDASSIERYEHELSHELESWRVACARVRAEHVVASSAERFESIVRRSFER